MIRRANQANKYRKHLRRMVPDNQQDAPRTTREIHGQKTGETIQRYTREPTLSEGMEIKLS